MMDRLTHRGPDDRGDHVAEHGVLGHTRLSIIDVAGGHQPIADRRRGRVLIANGELYNAPAWRQRLEPECDFMTRSDSEVALHLFDRYGIDTAGQLDGMFAVGITDDDQLYLARDPVGIKPLYIGSRDGRTVFASELKAVAGVVDDIAEFPPGTCWFSGSGFHRYHQFTDGRIDRDKTTAAHIADIRARLEAAVVKRLMSDVPVGAFLSGGLDSSVIAAIARQHVDQLHTFSIGTEGSRDLEAARRVSRHLDTIHHEYIITPREVIAKLPEIVYWLESFDQDLVRSAIPCYFTSRLAAEHVKVILTGEGADELFAGYTYYHDITDDAVLQRELTRSVSSLHNVNLQRVDRLTMAHSIEGRVPFLDLDLIELAQTVPPEIKMRRDGDVSVEKWVLRKACDDLLPEDIVWRKKEQFDEGSGTVDLLGRGLDRFMGDDEAEDYIADHPDAALRSAEEAVYHKLLCEAYDDPALVLANVGRWADRPDELACA